MVVRLFLIRFTQRIIFIAIETNLVETKKDRKTNYLSYR